MSELVENPKLAPWRDALLIVLLAPALVAGCYSAGFLEYDDSAHYMHELVVPETPLSDFARVTRSTYFPVTVLSYRLDRFLFESVPPAPMRRSAAAPGVRLHSLLLHVIAALFLWRALLHLRLGRWISLFAAATWAVHPAACESVCWISERKNVLAAFFGFVSLWVYFGAVRNVWLRALATGGLFVLAMLSKPNAAGFLPIYCAFDAFSYLQRRESAARLRSTDWTRILASLLLCAGCGCVVIFLAKLNIRMTDDSTVALAGGSLWTVALTDVPILAEYIFNALIPSALSIFYYSPIVTTLASGFFWVHAALLAAIVAGTLWISVHRWRTAFLWCWFVGALGPALNVVPIPYLMQDRYAYFSLPALLVIAAETVVQLYAKVRTRSRSLSESSKNMGAFATIGAVACIALISVLRSGVYRNDFELLSDAVVKQPRSSYARLNYALTLSGVTDMNEQSGRGDPAMIKSTREEVLKQIVMCEACPDFDRMLDPGRVRILEAVTEEHLGRVDAAYLKLTAELKLAQKPYNIPVAALALARIELGRGRAGAALGWLDYGAKSMPIPSTEITYLKGMCFEALKRDAEARAAYAEIQPGSLAFDRAQVRLKHLSVKNAN